jgi:Flp pilus assembly protein TadG
LGSARLSGQRGQSIAEFALMAPVMFFTLVLIFTGSQYLNAVVGLNGAARAGAIVGANSLNGTPGMSQNAVTDAAAAAVNREQGCGGCFTGSYNQCSSAPTSLPGCVWTEIDKSTAPSGRPVVIVHVQYLVTPFVPIFAGNVVVAQAAGEA